ncbi:MAG: hypothetical protein SYR96_21460, partial [Actinomycetota bacterium]|nr:hypothetical protein [Actinomycetota bacterium]
EEITEVPGIGRRTAEALLAALNPEGAQPAGPKAVEEGSASGAGPADAASFPAGGAGRTKAGANRSKVPRPAAGNHE